MTIHTQKRPLFLIAVLVAGLFAGTSLCAQESGIDIMNRYQNALRIDDLTSRIEYRNVNRRGQVQERTLTQYIRRSDEGDDQYQLLLQFEAPADVQGTATLTWQHADRPDDQWLYLPAIQATKRISASRKQDRFMGTEITFEDLSNYLSEDLDRYSYELTGIESRGDESCWVIVAVPTDEDEIRNSAYSRREIWISTATMINIYTAYYNKDGALQKEYEAWNVKKVEGTDYYRARNAKMSDRLTGNRTEIVYSGIRIDTGLDEELFSRGNLQSL